MPHRQNPPARFFIALDDEFLILECSNGEWHIDSKLKNTEPQSVAIDSFNSERVYCGTFRSGLLASDDNGKTWNQIGKKIIASGVTSLAFSPNEKRNGSGVLYVGTEPSMLFRSDNGGESFQPSNGLHDLPSANSWSFPPRPYTHHVRTIVSDPGNPAMIYVAIEAGALIRSPDSGKTWKDKVSGGPYDTHNLVTNPNSPGRLYSAAGDGYYESLDYGESWTRLTRGLRQTYLYGVAVNPGDPDTVLISASPGPFSAYNPEDAESHVYKKEKGGNWEEITEGLPEPEGTTVSFLTPDPNSNEGFYATNNKGIFETKDAGETWNRIDVPWKESFKGQHVHCVTLGKN